MESPEDIKPYNEEESKGKQVGEMFDSIARSYDLMNTFMTGGLHRYWRNKGLRLAADLLPESTPSKVLDVACGTGDVSFKLHQLYPSAQIIGIDLSAGMLEVADKKLAGKDEESRRHISFIEGDCLSLPVDDNSFDMVTVAYGVRNFERLEDGYREMIRVLRTGGVLCVIELSEPSNPFIRGLYRIYSHHVIPVVGKMVSKDPRAYTYLPESIAACPQRSDMTAMMSRAGFKHTTFKSLTLGVITIYIGIK